MLADLAKSGLDAADAKTLGFKPCTEADSVKLNLSRPGVGYVIPYCDADGAPLKMFRYRFRDTAVATGFTKGEKLRKYDQPKDTAPEIYLPPLLDWPAIIGDPTKPILITEGEKKGACGCKLYLPTLGLGGVFNFGSKAKHQVLVPALEQFAWDGRSVSIVFDSDAITNPQVLLAEMRLAAALTDRGAVVFIVRLPQVGKEKIGLDDYLLKYGPKELDELASDSDEYSASKALHQLNTEVVYIRHPSMVVELPKPHRPVDQPQNRMMLVASFKNEVYADRQHLATETNGKLTLHQTAESWMKWPARRAFDSIAYSPGSELFVNNLQYNLWEGWGAKPVKGDVSLFVELLDYAFSGADAGHRKWFLQWCAYPVQHPGVKLNTAVVFWSVLQGVGKSLLGYTLGRIYGRNYIEVSKANLVGSFNAWQANKQFVLGDEITGGDSREVADQLKSIITAPVVTVNEKFKPEYSVENHCNYMFTSQHQDAFFITTEDRRYFIHEVSEKAPDGFFARYDKWFKTQAATDALFDYLLSIDLKGFNPMAEAPRTKARSEMVDAGKSEHLAWCTELRELPDNKLRAGDVVVPYALYTTDDLLAFYQPENEVSRHKYPLSGKAMSAALKDAGFRLVADGATVETTKGRKQRVWAVRTPDKFASLSAKQAGEMYNQERSRKGQPKPKFVKG
jgi:hypothetical protein